MGIEILHKPHPSNPFPTPPVFDELYDIQRHMPPFEEVIHLADVLLFDYPMSTTFCNAAAADVPMVLIDIGVVDFKPDARKLLEQRCRIVPAHRDGNGLVQVDWQYLGEALSESSELRNTSYVERYYRHLL